MSPNRKRFFFLSLSPPQRWEFPDNSIKQWERTFHGQVNYDDALEVALNIDIRIISRRIFTVSVFRTFSSIRVIRGGRLGGSGTHTHPNYPHCVYRVSHLILTSSRYYCFEKLIYWDILVLLIIAQTLFSLSGIQINIIPIKIIFSNTDISKIKILSKPTILYTSLARRIWSCIDKN